MGVRSKRFYLSNIGVTAPANTVMSVGIKDDTKFRSHAPCGGVVFIPPCHQGLIIVNGPATMVIVQDCKRVGGL
jgi:hypothetical protein